MGARLPLLTFPHGKIEEEEHCPGEGDEEAGQEEGEHPVSSRIIQASCNRGTKEVAHPLAEQKDRL